MDKKKWDTTDEDKELEHIQKFFRMLLADDLTSFYYLFCQNNIVEGSHQWQLIKYHKCL